MHVFKRSANATRRRSPVPWPETVVDQLEIVEIDEQDGDTSKQAVRARQRALQSIRKQSAIRQTSECIMKGQLL
jgi:hypothetical protein